MSDIYAITESRGDYEIHTSVIGYRKTESEAKKTCAYLNDKIDFTKDIHDFIDSQFEDVDKFFYKILDENMKDLDDNQGWIATKQLKAVLASIITPKELNVHDYIERYWYEHMWYRYNKIQEMDNKGKIND